MHVNISASIQCSTCNNNTMYVGSIPGKADIVQHPLHFIDAISVLVYEASSPALGDVFPDAK